MWIPDGKDEKFPFCQREIQKSTVKHIIYHCPNLSETRIKFHMPDD